MIGYFLGPLPLSSPVYRDPAINTYFFHSVLHLSSCPLDPLYPTFGGSSSSSGVGGVVVAAIVVFIVADVVVGVRVALHIVCGALVVNIVVGALHLVTCCGVCVVCRVSVVVAVLLALVVLCCWVSCMVGVCVASWRRFDD